MLTAYSCLIDEIARANWEKYGNPDGPQAMSIGIALPSWLVKKDNSAVGMCQCSFVYNNPVQCWEYI